MSDYINLSNIATRLKEVVVKSGMSSNDFCKETDIPTSTLSQMLNGRQKVNVETINKVILRWGSLIDPNWFIFGENYQNTTSKASAHTELFASLSSTEHQKTELESTLLDRIEEIGRLKEVIASHKSKEIDHIMVFYTDNSFATYHLSQNT